MGDGEEVKGVVVATSIGAGDDYIPGQKRDHQLGAIRPLDQEGMLD